MRMFNAIIKDFKKRVCNEKGIFGIDDALLAVLISSGASIAGGMMSKGGSTSPEFAYPKEYPEAEEARETWWDKLQDWGGQPGYGAIPQDWGDIWDLAKKRVTQYYSGTPTTTGAMAKLDASAARRNASDSPALEMTKARLGAEEGGQLSDIAKTQAINEAAFAEQGRNTWLQSLMGLANSKPTSVSYMPEQQAGLGDLISTIGGGIGSALSMKSQQDWLTNLFKQPSSGSLTSPWGTGNTGKTLSWGF